MTVNTASNIKPHVNRNTLCIKEYVADGTTMIYINHALPSAGNEQTVLASYHLHGFFNTTHIYIRVLKYPHKTCCLIYLVEVQACHIVTAHPFMHYSLHDSRGLPSSWALCRSYLDVLTDWGGDKVAAIFQTKFSNASSWIKIFKFRLEIRWSLFQGSN